MRDPELDYNYVIVEIKKIKVGKDGKLYEVTEKKRVPDFVAEVLTGRPTEHSFRSNSSIMNQK